MPRQLAGRRYLAAVGAVVVVCLAGWARAEVYTWTDENGDEHFTDDLRKVPEPHKRRYLDQSAGERRIRNEAEARRKEEAEQRAMEDAFNAEMAKQASKGEKNGGQAPAPDGGPGKTTAVEPAKPPSKPVPAAESGAAKPDAARETPSNTRRPFEGWKGSVRTDKLVEQEIEEAKQRERREREKKHIRRIVDSDRSAVKLLNEEYDKIKDVSAVHTDVDRQRKRIKDEVKRLTEEIEYWEETLRMDY